MLIQWNISKTRPGHLVMPDPPWWLGEEKKDRPTDRPTKPFVGRPPGSGKQHGLQNPVHYKIIISARPKGRGKAWHLRFAAVACFEQYVYVTNHECLQHTIAVKPSKHLCTSLRDKCHPFNIAPSQCHLEDKFIFFIFYPDWQISNIAGPQQYYYITVPALTETCASRCTFSRLYILWIPF